MRVPARDRFLGLPLDPLTMEATVEQIVSRIAERRPGAHVSLNAANVVRAHRDPSYAAALESADLVSPDGQSVVWGGRLLGLTIPERVTGIDLMLELARRAPDYGWAVYLVGARPSVVKEVARRLEARRVRIVGHRDGYFSPAQDADVASDVVLAGADLLFVGMPTPRKEQFMLGAARPAGVPYTVGVGGSFDVIAGRVRRAPRLLQQVGLEWMYRLAQEPRRLLRRYTIDNARFTALLVEEVARRARRPRQRR